MAADEEAGGESRRESRAKPKPDGAGAKAEN
jgi:hypothetical protein